MARLAAELSPRSGANRDHVGRSYGARPLRRATWFHNAEQWSGRANHCPVEYKKMTAPRLDRAASSDLPRSLLEVSAAGAGPLNLPTSTNRRVGPIVHSNSASPKALWAYRVDPRGQKYENDCDCGSGDSAHARGK